MSVHLYAICEADGAVAPAGRPGRVRPELVVADDLAALVDEGSERSPSPSVEELWAHEETVEELMATCDLLPVRYGSDVDDRDAVQRLLRMRHDELAEGLRRVRGAVELAVRARVLTAPKRQMEELEALWKRGAA